MCAATICCEYLLACHVTSRDVDVVHGLEKSSSAARDKTLSTRLLLHFLLNHLILYTSRRA
jgi:hypothetical protein